MSETVPVLLAYLESAKFLSSDPALIQFIVSYDHGITWSEQPEILNRNVWVSPIVARGSRAIVGNQNWFHPVENLPYDHVSRSDDAGATWFGTVSPSEYPLVASSPWNIRGGGFFTDDIVFMVGYWKITALSEVGMAMRSTDGGLSFVPVQPPGLYEAAFDDEIWGMGVANETTGYVASVYGGPGWGYRTLNAGETWSAMDPFYVGPYASWVSSFVPCGSKVFALGQYYYPPPGLRAEGLPGGDIPNGAQYRPTLWTSTNNGVSWTNTPDPFPDLAYLFDQDAAPGWTGTGGQQRPLCVGLADADGLTAVVAMAANVAINNTPTQSWFRYTTDGGTTWKTCTYSPAPDQADWGLPTQITRAADGAWIAHIAYDGFTNPPEYGGSYPLGRFSRADIWRGTPSGETLHWTRVVSANDWHAPWEGTCQHGGVALVYAEPPPAPLAPFVVPTGLEMPGRMSTRLVGVWRP